MDNSGGFSIELTDRSHETLIRAKDTKDNAIGIFKRSYQGQEDIFYMKKEYQNYGFELNNEEERMLTNLLSKLKSDRLQMFSYKISHNGQKSYLDFEFEHHFKNLQSLMVELRMKNKCITENELLYITRTVIDLGDELENNLCFFPEISLETIKLYSDESNQIIVNSPLLYDYFVNSLLNKVIVGLGELPDDVRSNRFIYDSFSRKRFLRLNQDDDAFTKLGGIDDFVHKNSQIAVFQLFLCLLSLACRTEEEKFKIPEIEYTRMVKEKIAQLDYSEDLKVFLRFILVDSDIDQLPTFSQLKRLYSRSSSLSSTADFQHVNDRNLGFKGAKIMLKSHFGFYQSLFSNNKTEIAQYIDYKPVSKEEVDDQSGLQEVEVLYEEPEKSSPYFPQERRSFKEEVKLPKIIQKESQVNEISVDYSAPNVNVLNVESIDNVNDQSNHQQGSHSFVLNIKSTDRLDNDETVRNQSFIHDKPDRLENNFNDTKFISFAQEEEAPIGFETIPKLLNS